MKWAALSAIYLSAIATPAFAGLGLSSFYVTNSAGEIFAVDGDTLTASSQHQISTSGFVNEIEYLSETSMLVNMSGAVMSVNLQTGEEEVVFNASDYYTDSSTNIMVGLARRGLNEMYMTVHSVMSDGSLRYAAGSMNTETFDYSEIHTFSSIPGIAIDHHELRSSLILSAYNIDQRILLHSATTGEILEIYELDYEIVSFMELSDRIYTVSREGTLYEFRFDSGNSFEVGQISGFSGNLIGATVPAPGGLALIGFAGFASTQRRR